MRLLRLFLINSYRIDKDQRKKRMYTYLAIGLVLAPVIVVFALLVGGVGFFVSSFAPEMAAQVLTAILLSSMVLVTVLGLFAMLQVVYFSKDAEFLLSLPIPPANIFAAKIGTVYVYELATTVASALPLLIAFGIGYNLGSGESLSVMYWVLIPFAILLLPIVPLLLVAILSFPVMSVVNFLKKRSATALILALVGFGALFSIYFFGISALTSLAEGIGEDFDIGMIATLLQPFEHFYPIAFLSNAMADGNFLHLFFFFASVVALLAVSLGVAQLLYKRNIISSLESIGMTKSKQPDVLEKLRQSAPETLQKTLVKKEFKLLSRETNFAFQSYSAVLLCPLIIIVMGLTGIMGMNIDTNGYYLVPVAPYLQFVGMATFMVFMFLGGTNYTAYIAFTREGKFFYINKYLPVPYEEVFKAKLQFASIVSAIGVVLAAIAFTVVLIIIQENALIALLNGVLFTGAAVIVTYSLNRFGLMRDLRRPKLNWANMQEALKSNTYAMLPMLIAGVAGIFSLILGSALPVLPLNIPELALLAIFWGITYLLSALVFVFFGRKKKNADSVEQLFEKIQC